MKFSFRSTTGLFDGSHEKIFTELLKINPSARHTREGVVLELEDEKDVWPIFYALKAKLGFEIKVFKTT